VFLSVITLDQASSLPGGAASSHDLGEKVRATRVKPNHRQGIGAPITRPYFCSRPYQYRYWQFCPPIYYPL
jgi:hypothetical protein